MSPIVKWSLEQSTSLMLRKDIPTLTIALESRSLILFGIHHLKIYLLAAPNMVKTSSETIDTLHLIT